jgi:hypothetical protein
MVFGILLATGLFYLIFADGTVQSWNDPNNRRHNGTVAENGNGHSHTKLDDHQELKDNFIKNSF